MKALKKFISTLLTVCLLFGSLSGLFTFSISASGMTTPVVDPAKVDYLTKTYYTEEQMMETMSLWVEKGAYQLWVNTYNGVVALVNTITGERLFTNPYDVNLGTKNNDTKAEVLSQIIVTYEDNGEKTFNSYADAALNNQIKTKSIKNGVRLEYTLGREETKYLVPRLITRERFETQILSLVTEGIWERYRVEGAEKGWDEKRIQTNAEFDIKKFTSFFTLNDPEDPKYQSSDAMLAALYNKLPIVAELGAVYELNTARARDLVDLEVTIKTYCPDYTFEELDLDHETTEYESEDDNPAVFKVALEYTLDDLGLRVTLPANGIRFDESSYTLKSLQILPYMGAARYSAGENTDKSMNTGYTFFPDGSGAIFRFEEMGAGEIVAGEIYGYDYAYTTISGADTSKENIRMPVYGLVQNEIYSYIEDDTGAYQLVENETPKSRGFFAIVEEGDALAKLSSYHMGAKADFHTLQLTVNPRPSDSYNVADVISVGESGSQTITSDRKYMGNYTVRYLLLTDDAVAEEKGLTNTYSTDYFGMAEAYRDYLTSPYSTGTQNEAPENQTTVLTRLDKNATESTIPLYLETFGTMETVEKVLSVPVNVMTPLTTFENVEQIYADLSQEGVDITNINFKLTGYANGGLYSTMPYKLKWEKAVGGKSGFEHLVQTAQGINKVSATDGSNLGIFPEFDFANVTSTDSFDGFSIRKHAVKTIDDRYTGKRTYSATYQMLERTGSLVVSPASFSHFYNKLATNYLKYSLAGDGTDLGISASTLGTDLSSDFDEDDPYNREDTKQLTAEAVKALSDSYGQVMVSGGNAYTWQYVDHILDLPIDGSRYLCASSAIPFTGIVLHGYMQYAGRPINMEGNIQYGLLKAIENGASVQFVLTYDNATKLKEDYFYSRYYSVRYDIWAGSYNDEGVFEAGDLVDIYHTLNDAIGDLQATLIIDHELLSGQRIPDADELEADQKAEAEAAEKAEAQAKLEAEAKLLAERYEARTSAKANAQSAVATATAKVEALKTLLDTLATHINTIKTNQEAIAALATGEDASALQANIQKAMDAIQSILYVELGDHYKAVMSAKETVEDKVRIVNEAVTYFRTSGNYSQQFIDDNAGLVADIQVESDKMATVVARAEEYKTKFFEDIQGIIELEDIVITEEEEEVVDTINERYLVDDGSIVAVTYGEQGAPVRTFLLNYNYYTIKVTYNGTEYEIDRYGFVVIDSQA